VSNDIGRYRRAYPRLFRHPAFKKLSPLCQRLVVYILYGPQSNRIGLFYFSVNTAAEDLDSTPDSLRKALREVTLSFGWSFDALARVLFIPSWWRWNPPDHEKVLRGNLKDLHEIPPCGLTDAFAQNLAYLKAELHGTFVEACRVAMPKATGSQYQYQVPVSGSGTGTPALRARPRKAGFEKNTNGNGSESAVPTRLVEIARTTLNLNGWNTPIDDLAEGFLDYQRQTDSGSCSRSEAIAALNVALAEQRIGA
jgi:hypothetical protein